MAAGATLPSANVEEFRRRLNEYAALHCPEMPAPELKLDCRLNPVSLNVGMPRDLRRLEPFGSGNPQPLFGLFGMELREIVPVGGGGHLRLVCAKSGATLSCMRFGVRAEEFPFAPGDKLDLAVTLDLREYRDEERLTVTVRDVRPAGFDDERNLHGYRLYEKFRRRESFTGEEEAFLAPTRDDLAVLYRKLSALRGAAFGHQSLLGALQGFHLGKLLLCLDILEERGLIRCESEGETCRAQLIHTEGKVDIFDSQVFRELKALTGRGERGEA